MAEIECGDILLGIERGVPERSLIAKMIGKYQAVFPKGYVMAEVGYQPQVIIPVSGEGRRSVQIYFGLDTPVGGGLVVTGVVCNAALYLQPVAGNFVVLDEALLPEVMIESILRIIVLVHKV